MLEEVNIGKKVALTLPAGRCLEVMMRSRGDQSWKCRERRWSRSRLSSASHRRHEREDVFFAAVALRRSPHQRAIEGQDFSTDPATRPLGSW